MFFHNYREITMTKEDVELIAKRANDVRNTLEKTEGRSKQEEIDLVHAIQLTEDAEGVLNYINKSGDDHVRFKMG